MAPETEPAPEVAENPPVRPWTAWRSDTTGPISRADEARNAKRADVERLFATARVAFPPAQLLLRGFKKERKLEVWASSRAGDRLTHVTTYEICAISGELGPKRKRGDMQVPEGFYNLSEYSPATPYYLAILVTYPNTSDRILGDRDPGDEIMIHGRCASVGCLSMSDERIQEIWVATTALRSAGGVVYLHVFPSRDMKGLLAGGEHPEHRAFWENLAEGAAWFDEHRRLPQIRVDRDGRYSFR